MVDYARIAYDSDPSKIWLYARKSTASEGASKSIKDQVSVMIKSCQKLGIAVTEANVHAEEPGHGGDEWWHGGGLSGLKNGKRKKNRCRPVLTQMVEGVIDGSVKCIICYSQDRLWRDTGICDAMIDLLNEYGVTLIDRYGPVDIQTTDGRNKVRSCAVAAQTYRERAAEDSLRGTEENREVGKLVICGTALGYRAVGGHSAEVIVVPEEIAMAERIFRMYVHGEHGDGPMSASDIAERLMQEGYAWMPDVKDKRKDRRNEFTKGFIYHNQIVSVLKNCRYQGRQPHAGKEWPCDAFLIDGKPAIPTKLYEDAQAKLKGARKFGNRTNLKRGVTGLLRCGICAQAMYCHPVGQKKNGERTIYWRTSKAKGWTWCSHKLPNVRETILDEYIDTVFAPLLLADIREQLASVTESDLMNSIASLRRRLCDLDSAFERKIEGWVKEDVSGLTIKIAEREHMKTTGKLTEEIKRIELQVRDLNDLDVNLQDLATLPPEARTDSLHRAIRWIAVLPSAAPREKSPSGRERWRRATDGGRVVFFTAYNTYHCATLVYGDIGDVRPQYFLRPSTLAEMVATVAEFPDPCGFLDGLRRAYQGRNFAYDPDEMGVVPNINAPTVAEFTVSEELIDGEEGQ